ncbi:hypothetical protein Cni_G25727 [Canna indica]|uniref:Uncharacterized protein n=1 Tax=Canna indica TaxID=4628 RepID=A0AAQ3KY58_9LILI|nr:hypothetical protein Cni_G25727 [Canna indica]
MFETKYCGCDRSISSNPSSACQGKDLHFCFTHQARPDKRLEGHQRSWWPCWGKVPSCRTREGEEDGLRRRRRNNSLGLGIRNSFVHHNELTSGHMILVYNFCEYSFY